MIKRRVIIIICVIIILSILCVSIQSKKEIPKVHIKIVKKENITAIIRANGYLKASPQINIASEIVGKIQKIYVKVGQRIKKGDLLCKISDVDAIANLSVTQARYGKAKRVYEHAVKLAEKKLIAVDNLEDIKCDFQIAEAEYQKAVNNYNKTRIYSPISGTIIQINVEEGEIVIMGTMNNPGTVILTVANLDKMLAVVKISEGEIPFLKVGQKVLVSAEAIPSRKFAGVVSEIGMTPIKSDEGGIDFECFVELTDTCFLLKPGMTVKAEIITAFQDSTLTLPISAITDSAGVEYVFLYTSHRAKKKEVKTGIYSDTDIEITSGLKIDDTVIIGPYHILSKLTDGNEVSIK